MNPLTKWRLRRFYKRHIQEIGESFDDWSSEQEWKIKLFGVGPTLRSEEKRIHDLVVLSKLMNEYPSGT